MSKLVEAVDRVDQEIKSLKSLLEGNECISSLRNRIQLTFERKEVEIKEINNKCTTPTKISPRNSIVAIEDFPNSPTLEELGLSGHTLSIVGRRTGFDSSASISDGEFDNSFYQK